MCGCKMPGAMTASLTLNFSYILTVCCKAIGRLCGGWTDGGTSGLVCISYSSVIFAKPSKHHCNASGRSRLVLPFPLWILLM